MVAPIPVPAANPARGRSPLTRFLMVFGGLLLGFGAFAGVVALVQGDDPDVIERPRDRVTAFEYEEAELCEVELRTVRTAIAAFHAVNGTYPASLDELLGDWLDPSEFDPSVWSYEPSTGMVVRADGLC